MGYQGSFLVEDLGMIWGRSSRGVGGASRCGSRRDLLSRLHRDGGLRLEGRGREGRSSRV